MSDSAYDVLNAAPEMLSSPSLAASAMVSPDPYATSQVMAHAQMAQAVDEHVEKHKSHFGWVPGWAKKPVSWTAETLNKPLGMVQHEYRFVHDVWERDGAAKGLMALGVGTVGGVAGGVVGGLATFGAGAELGAMLGTEGALKALGEFGGDEFEESWDRTEKGEDYRDSKGRLVSPGRDLVRLLDHVVPGNLEADHKTTFGALSGTGDAVFDLTLDPLMIAGKLNQGRKAAAYGAGKNATRGLYQTDEAGNVLDEMGYRLGTGDKSAKPMLRRPTISETETPADRVLEVYRDKPRFRQMVDILAKSSTQDIYDNLPKLSPLARELGEATTHDDVLNVFRDALTAKNYSVLHAGLPRTGLTASPVTGATFGTRVKNKILNAGYSAAKDAEGKPILTDVSGRGDGSDLVPMVRANRLGKAIRTFTSYRAYNVSDDLKTLSAKEFNPADESSAETIGQILRYSQNARTANAIKARWAAADTLAERTNIYVNAVTDMMRAFGIRDDAEILTKWRADLQRMADNSGAVYGLDRDGLKVTTKDAAGRDVITGLMSNQVGKFAMPDFQEMRRAFLEDKNALRRLNGKADDWMYRAYTSTFFKPLALLSLGFAFRVAGGELLPATVRYGKDTVKGGVAAYALKYHPDLGKLLKDVDLSPEHYDRLKGIRVSHTPADGSYIEVHRGVADYNGLDETGREFTHADELLGHMAPDHPHFGAWWDRDPKVAEFYGADGENGVVVSARFHKDDLVDDPNATGLKAKPGARGEITRVRAAVPGKGLVDLPHKPGTKISAREGQAPARPTGVGTISWVDAQRGIAGVKFGGKEFKLPLDELDAYHHPIPETGVRLIAKQAGIQVSKEEVPHIRAAVSRAMYGVSKGLIDPDYLLTAHLNVIQNEGHIVAGALASDHGEHRVVNSTDDIQDSLKHINKTLPNNKRLGKDWNVFDGSEQYHPMYWNYAIHEAARDMQDGAAAYVAAKRAGASDDQALEAFTQADMGYVKANNKKFGRALAAHANAGPEGFSKARGRAFQGLVHSGPQGAFGVVDDFGNVATKYHYHDFVAEAIAAGDAPTLARLDKVPVELRPRVKGRVMEDVPTMETLNNITNKGFRKVLQPMINGLAREPIFTTAVTHEYKALKPFIEKGVMSPAEANWIAQQRAVPQMLPLIHNTHLRSQAAEYMRNYLPFYYAQEQAYRRYAKAFTTSPLAFARLHLMVHGLHGAGLIHTDDEGQNYVVFPGLGAGSDHLAAAAQALNIPVIGGIPNRVSGNVSSLKSVIPGGLVGIPEVPGVSPLGAIAAKRIEAMFPATEPFLSEVVGPIGQNQTAVDALIPNSFLRNVYKALPVGERTRQFQSAWMFSIQNAARRADELRSQAETVGADTAEGQRLMAQADELMPGPNADPQARQKAINRIRNTTRLMFLVRAVYSGTLPMSPKVDVGDFQLRDELASMQEKYGFSDGLSRFLDKHPDATADSVFQSDNKYTGTSVPHGETALAWIRDNRDFVNSHSLASAYLIPQVRDGFSSEAYNLELATGLAHKRTPEEFVNAIYAAAGNARYYPLLKMRDEAIAARPEMESEIRSQFAAMKNQMAFDNPIWFSEISSPERTQTAHLALGQLRDSIDNGLAPASPQTERVRELISYYDMYNEAEQVYRQQGYALKPLKEKWESFLDDYATQHPEAVAVINGVFRRLPAYEQYGEAVSA